MQGWIKLHRKILTWKYYKDKDMYKLFTHLLLKANRFKGTYKGQVVLKGQLITSIRKLSTETGLSIQTVRTCLAKLSKPEKAYKSSRKLTQEITQEPTQLFNRITICNYAYYQSIVNKSNTETNTAFNTDRPVYPAGDGKYKGPKNENKKSKNIYIKNDKKTEKYPGNIFKPKTNSNGH